ncbi:MULTISPECIES: DUF2922 domain-containing protein [Sporosarcina]|uniref:DUF2922 domain-containing protein n=1 Tax=Sporosarcina contaminans TaxID=633403 RepID=A0ABW3TYA7_9BACL
MAKTLQLHFNTAAGKQTTLSVDNPRGDLTSEEVEDAMQLIIDANVFEVDGSPLATLKSARLIERNVTELIRA